jgi:hypothetical protein
MTKDNKTYLGLTIFSLLCSIFLLTLVNSGRAKLSDLKVYYGGSKDLQGSTIEHIDYDFKPDSDGSIYTNAYGLGSGYYKYQPTSLIVYYPLIFFTWDQLKVIWPFVYCFLAIFTMYLVCSLVKEQYFENSSISKNQLFILLFTCAHQHIYRELYISNFNFFLLLFGMLFLQSKNIWGRATALAFLINIKVHFVLTIPIFIYYKKYKELVYSIIVSLIMNLILVITLGFDKLISLYVGWIKMIHTHNKFGGGFESLNTVYHWPKVWLKESISSSSFLLIFYFILLIIGILFLYYYGTKKKQIDFKFCIILIYALVPSVSNTDTNHFIFSLPLLALILLKIFDQRKHYFYLFIPIAIYAINFYDFVGPELNSKITQYGLIGMANTVFILTVLYFLYRGDKYNKIVI